MQVPVWDLPVRLFHWALVLAIGISWASGEWEWRKTHYWSGLAVLGLVAFRVLWGLVGSRNARFAHFVRGPSSAFHYLRRAIAARSPSYTVGHNPAGGLMVVALLAVCALQTLSGMVNTDDVLFDGPLRDNVPERLAGLLSALHKPLSNLLVLMIALHVGVIMFYRLWKRENLIAPMVFGWMRLPSKHGATESALGSGAKWRLGWALLCLAVAAAIPAAIHLSN